MCFLHDRRPSPVLHGDLKTSNILIEEDGKRVAICDFGLSGFMNNQNAAMQRGALTITISPPEVLEDPTRPRTPAADVFAFSILLLEIMVGRPPYLGMKPAAVKQQVLAGQRPPIPDGVPDDVRCIIQECWAQDPGERPTFRDVLGWLEAAMAAAVNEARCNSAAGQQSSSTAFAGAMQRGAAWSTGTDSQFEF